MTEEYETDPVNVFVQQDLVRRITEAGFRLYVKTRRVSTRTYDDRDDDYETRSFVYITWSKEPEPEEPTKPALKPNPPAKKSFWQKLTGG